MYIINMLGGKYMSDYKIMKVIIEWGLDYAKNEEED